MESQPLKQLTVTDKRIAQLLTDTETAQRLEPFLGREATLSEAAKTLHMTLPALLYHVNRFIALGLLEVAREEVRKGRAVKYYRTVADVFFVPFELTPSETLGRLLFDLTESSERRFHREAARALQTLSATWGLYLTRGKDGRMVAVLSPNTRAFTQDFSKTFFSPSTPALFLVDGEIRFDFGTAKAFQRELRDLLERYQAQQSAEGHLYAYRLGLTPLEDDTLGD